MSLTNTELNILIVEDNPGDFILIEEYLKEKSSHLTLYRARTFIEAGEKIKGRTHFDAILLDLSLPDSSGEVLVKEIIQLAGSTPIVVLTGFSDKDFGIKTLSWGISDYLLKDDLDASKLFRSISYSIERKRVAIQLHESEEKYKRLFHFSPLPMWVYDIKTLHILSVNEASIAQYGYSNDEFLNKNVSQIWPYKSYEEHLEKLDQLRGLTTRYRGIVQHIKKSGELIYVEIQSDEIDFDGKKSRLVLATDITEKIKSAKALQLSEQRFKALVQDGSDLIAILGTEGDYKYVSPASESILGIPPNQLVGKMAMDFIHEGDKERVQQNFNLLDRQKSIQIAPFRFKDAFNKWRWIETKLTNMQDDPAVGGIVSNSREVTERIENEIKLKESIERFNMVSMATNDIIWDWDLKTSEVGWNENIRTVLGYSNLHTNIAWWRGNLHPEDALRVNNKIDESIKALRVFWSDEYRFRSADGTFKYFLDRGFLIMNEKGNPVRMIGSMQDVTRRMEEEHRLKLLESVITYATDAVMITEAQPINPPGPKIVYINDAFTKMTGYSKDEVIGKSPRMFQGSRTSREKLDKLRKALENWEACDIEIVNYKKNGESFWINMTLAPVTDTTGKYTHWISIQRDITERMNYIKAIEDQNERLKEIAWTQSHIVRAPLARIMGLIEIIPKYQSFDKIPPEILPHILNSAHELDDIIRDIVIKTEVIYNSPKNEA
jgi:PAS domain S-box-containing protein